MKKNDWIFLLSVLAYSFLFYSQTAGINFFIFSVLLTLFQGSKNKDLLRKTPWLIAASGVLLSSFCVFYYGNSLSIIANIISLMLLSALSYSPSTSIIVALLFSMLSIGGSFVFMILDAVERNAKKVSVAAERSSALRLMIYFVPLVLGLVFFFLYKGSNPLFDEFTKKINLDFISPLWILFTLLGSFLVYGFFYHKTISAIAGLDKSIPNELINTTLSQDTWLSRNLSIENEVRSGVILLAMLNILLLIVNLLDINYLWFSHALPAGMSYSVFVHQGTGLLILSIIIAILIIMFYFQGRVNFFEKNKTIRFLALAWIIQNAFMILSTSFRNNLYINEYCLTYKRIGVYVWLLLALIGLCTTFWKIIKLKSNWFLFRSNSWLFYGVLVISSIINWDDLVTNFNIEKAVSKNKTLDKFYLLSLSDGNLPELFRLNDSIKNESWHESDYGFISAARRTSESQRDFKTELSQKLYAFMDRMNKKDWQSWNIEDSKTLEELRVLNREEKISGLKFNSWRAFFPAAIKEITNLKSLDLENVYSLDCYELRYFQKLEKLILINSVTDVSRMPVLENLTELDLSNNRLENIFSLRRLKNLEKLTIEGNPNIKSFAVLSDLKKLKYLKIGLITKSGYQTLQRTYPDLKIDATIAN
jgi:hypothetical protein